MTAGGNKQAVAADDVGVIQSPQQNRLAVHLVHGYRKVSSQPLCRNIVHVCGTFEYACMA